MLIITIMCNLLLHVLVNYCLLLPDLNVHETNITHRHTVK